MYDRERRNKTNPKSAIISLIIALLFLLPAEIIGWIVALALFIAPLVLIVWFALRGGKKRGKKEKTFDDCPKTFCFHKDKGEHHVKKGREIDPWDRPDIDISKYQRR
jgi:hypothetical protein